MRALTDEEMKTVLDKVYLFTPVPLENEQNS